VCNLLDYQAQTDNRRVLSLKDQPQLENGGIYPNRTQHRKRWTQIKMRSLPLSYGRYHHRHLNNLLAHESHLSTSLIYPTNHLSTLLGPKDSLVYKDEPFRRYVRIRAQKLGNKHALK